MAEQDTGRLREIAGLCTEGLTAYRNREWDKAEKAYKSVLQSKAGDGPATVFLKRIQELRNVDLPEDWDGVFVMTKK